MVDINNKPFGFKIFSIDLIADFKSKICSQTCERITKSYLNAKEPFRFEKVDGRIIMMEHFNILDIEDFFTWATKITDNLDGTQVEYRTLSGPPFLRARNAPNKLKDEAIVMLNRLKNRYPKNSYLDDIIKELNQPQVEVDRENFARWNSKLDELRDEKLKDANPRLWSWLNREGVV